MPSHVILTALRCVLAAALLALSWAVPSVANDKVVFSRDGQSLAAAHGRDVLVLDVETGATRRTIPVGAGQNGPGGLVFSDDGKTLAVGNIQRRRSSTGKMIEFWPLSGAAAPVTVEDEGWAAVMVSNGTTIASIGRGFDETVRLWEWADRRLVRSVPVAAAFAGEVAIARGAPWFATWSKVSSRGVGRSAPAPARLWSTDTGAEVATFGSFVDGVIAFSGHQHLVSGTPGEIALWTLPNGVKITAVPAFEGAVVRLHATEAKVWAVGQRAAKSWELQAWKLPNLEPQPRWVLPIPADDFATAGGFGFSPDGRLLALYREQNAQPPETPALVRIFDTTNGREVQRIVLPAERIER